MNRPYNPLELGISRLTEVIAKYAHAKREKWLSGEMAKRLSPDVFLRAYGNQNCKQDVARILEENGWELRCYPNGDEELVIQGKVVSKYAAS